MPWRLLFHYYRKRLKFTIIPVVTPGSGRLYFASLLDKIDGIKKENRTDPSREFRVWLVDDDQDDRDMFEEAIARINPGIKVETLNNGISMIQHLESGNVPEMIFLDLNMPGKSGKECLAMIRSNPLWRKIPVVIYSTSANKKDVSDTFSAGANLYLLKPNSFSELIKVIQRAFKIDFEASQVAQKDFLLING
jgi:CheY-like chemotaxis protein